MITTDKINKYHQCIINKLLHIKIDGCNIVFDDSCNNCNQDVLYLSAVLDALLYADANNMSNEVQRFESIFNSQCGECGDCNSHNSTISTEPIWQLETETCEPIYEDV